MRWAVWWVVLLAALCGARKVHRTAAEFEQLALRREAVRASNASLEFLMTPARLHQGVEILTTLGLVHEHAKKQPQPTRDLELFDLTSRTAEILKEIMKHAGQTGKHSRTMRMELQHFRQIRPALAIMPPLRIINDAKEQFHYYAGKHPTLSASMLRKSLKNFGIVTDEESAGNMIKRIQVYDESVNCVDQVGRCEPTADRCEFVAAVLSERGLLSEDLISDADTIFEKMKKAANADNAPMTEVGVPLFYWFQTEVAKRVFSKDDLDPASPQFSRIRHAVSWMYNIAGDDEAVMLDRCEHRILHHFANMVPEDEEDDNINTPQGWRFQQNKVGAWLAENFGKRNLLSATCKKAGDRRNRCLLISKLPPGSVDDCTTHKETLTYNGNRFCDLEKALKHSHSARELRPPAYFDLEQQTLVPYNPLLNGVDGLFLIFDHDGDLNLSSDEFEQLAFSISLFGEMALLSTAETPNDRTPTGSPLFHLWYLAKGARYSKNLLKKIAKMSLDKMQHEGFKNFWKSIHYPELSRTWDRFTPEPNHPLNKLDLQGMYNRIRGGNMMSVAGNVIRDWRRPDNKFCMIDSLDKLDKFGVASLLFEEGDANGKLGDKYCKTVFNSPALSCKCGKRSEDALSEVCSCEGGGEKDLEMNNRLTIVDMLDSVLMGIPNFAQRMHSADLKLLTRMLVGINDNFDEITPERWQLLSPIIRAFLDLDDDHSGSLSQEEFRAFGKCTSFVMPRFRLPANLPATSLWNKVKGISTLQQIVDPIDTGKFMRSVPLTQMTLPEFALLFSSVPSESCLRSFCAKKLGEKDGVLKDSCLLQEGDGLKLFCIQNDDAQQDARCKTFVDEYKALPKDKQEQVLTNLKDVATNELPSKSRCLSYGSISFESYLDPEFSSEVKDSRSAQRFKRCELEYRCRSTAKTSNSVSSGIAKMFSADPVCEDFK